MNDPWLGRYQSEAIPVIRETFGALRIILFGSRVRGEASEHSDLDVTIVLERFEPFLKRAPMVLEKVPFPKHIEYICYILEDFDRIRQ